jgi:uncharacterized repeat protein (TIGR03803 family)
MPSRQNLAIVALAAGLPALAAQAQTLTTLHAFTGGNDGSQPNSPLLYHGGTLFGVTVVGGSGGQGTVYSVDPASGAETVLHAFAPGNGSPQNPAGKLIFHGRLYGTSLSGGTNCVELGGCGTVFRVDPASGKEDVVYSFAGTTDGAAPDAGVIVLGGLLYGTTTGFGTQSYGTVFTLNPATGAETVLHRFTGADGSEPEATLMIYKGALWGTTAAGGNDGCAQEGCGTVFQVDPSSGGLTVAYTFTSTPDGASPGAGLVEHGGMFYGTTTWGGSGDFGSVFSFNPATGVEKVLYSFSGLHDGGNPTGGLIYENGLLYGTTSLGGSFTRSCIDTEQRVGCGTIFSVNPRSGATKTLYRFTGAGDGSAPAWSLIYQDGAFYGTTSSGGTAGNGTVFKFVP